MDAVTNHVSSAPKAKVTETSPPETVPPPNGALAVALASLRREVAGLRERVDGLMGDRELDQESETARETSDERFRIHGEDLRRMQVRVKELGARVTDIERSRREPNNAIVERLDDHERGILRIIPRLVRVEGLLAALVDDE